MKIKIRFNKPRGQEGRGTVDHVWRVFVGDVEYLCKHVVINIPCRSEKECCSEDWNFVCDGDIQLDRNTGTLTVV